MKDKIKIVMGDLRCSNNKINELPDNMFIKSSISCYNNEITILIFAALLGVLWLATVPLTSGIISVVFGLKYMSMLYGFTFLSHQFGSFLGSWFGGRLYDIYGSYDLMWWLCVFLGFASAAMHMPIIEKAVPRLSYQS